MTTTLVWHPSGGVVTAGEGRTKLALVKGGSSGIGFELAGVFARSGYDVVIAAKDEVAADKLSGREATVHANLDEADRHREPLRARLGEGRANRLISMPIARR
jgi:NAD(P)-dependent dehydrogenase (short-subunit alcohol dehydrogenase family)